jgi:hypothetical protein
MFNLKINSEDVELSSDVIIQLSRLILDVSDISNRGIKISNAIMLPFTNKNDRLLGYPSRLNSNNLAFEQSQTYTLTENNNIVSTGDVIIKSFDEKKGIKIQLAEGYNFWSFIGSKQLIDLNLFEFDEIFGNTAFTNLKPKTDSIWLWGLTHDSTDTSQTALNNLKYSRPQYRKRRIIEQIVEKAGYELDYTNVLDVTILDDMGIISNAQNFSTSDYMRSWSNVTISAGTIDLTTGTLEFQEPGNVSETLSTTLTNNLYATSYVVKGSITAFGQTQLTITATGAETVTWRVALGEGENIINFRTDEIEIGSDTVFSIDSDVIFEDVRIYSHMNESDIAEIEGTWQAPGQASINEGYLILSDYNLPAMTQAQFFKTVITQLFLKVDVDNLNKVVKVEPFSYILNTNNAIDLSNSTEKFPTVTSGQVFGQLNFLTYQNEDTINEEFGRATFDVRNTNAPRIKEFISMPQYSASKEILISGNTTVKTEIYNITEATRVSIRDRVVYFATGTGIDYTCQFIGVGWQDLYSKNYFDFIESIKRERRLQANALISYLDFESISETPIIYIGELSSYFLVLSIDGYEEGKFSQLELIKYV